MIIKFSLGVPTQQQPQPTQIQITDKNMVIPENISQRDKQALMQQIIQHQQQIELQKDLERKQAQKQLQDLQDKIRGRTITPSQQGTNDIQKISQFNQQFNQRNDLQATAMMDSLITTTNSPIMIFSTTMIPSQFVNSQFQQQTTLPMIIGENQFNQTLQQRINSFQTVPSQQFQQSQLIQSATQSTLIGSQRISNGQTSTMSPSFQQFGGQISQQQQFVSS